MRDATKNRAAWMQEGPLGLMVHYLKHVHPFGGHPRVEDWNEMVDGFDLGRFCDAVVSTGAKWLIFTIGQNTGTYCSPNEYLESILHGREVAGRVAAVKRGDAPAPGTFQVVRRAEAAPQVRDA